MTDTLRLRGVHTALITPFTDRGSIDEAGLDRLVDRQLAAGVAGIVACGTTGEGATLDDAERAAVVARIAARVRAAGRPVTVLAGAGGNETRATVDNARRARDAGADGALIVTPYYNKPTQAGLRLHFEAVADGGGLPVVLYNVPSRTGVNLFPETALALAAHPGIVAIKEASGSLDQAGEILRGRPPGFAVLSGEDSLTLPMIALGADGVIAVVGNEAPALLVRLVDLAFAGSRADAAALHARLLPLMRANFRQSNPIPVKWALARLGLCGGTLRPPLTALESQFHGELESALCDAGLLDGNGLRRAS